MSRFMEFIEDNFGVDVNDEEQMDGVALQIQQMLAFRQLLKTLVES